MLFRIEEIGVAAFVNRELNRYTTPFGRALLAFCRAVDSAQTLPALPKGETKEEKILRARAMRMARALGKTAGRDLFTDETAVLSEAEYEALLARPAETREERREKRAAVREANGRWDRYDKAMKPRLWARRHILLAETYADLEAFTAGYPEAKQRVADGLAAQKAAAELAAAARKRETMERKNKK